MMRSAMRIVQEQGFGSVAFPILGSGSGGFSTERPLELMADELHSIESGAQVVVVRYRKRASHI